MEMSDDYQDMVNPGGGMSNLQPMGGHHRNTPESTSTEADVLSRTNLEAFQAAVSNGVINLPGFIPIMPLSNMGIGGMIQASSSSTPMQVAGDGPSTSSSMQQVLNVPLGNNNQDATSSPSRSSESPQGSRNGPDSATNYSLNVSNNTNNNHHHHSHNSSASSSSQNNNNNNNNNNSSQNNNNHTSQNGQQPNNWNFEDQFKQLYELSDDPGRREFLDDLFSYMQARGSPINRLPIMAKSVLDLYELFNLVIARGGLVDVINKKLWQEIIKGLQLPSSITSAAFTLRTQYMKYLYDYECDRKNLSTREDLQLAIDGNRREGRRNTYVQYPSGSGSDGQRNQSTSLSMRSRISPNAMQLHTQISPLSLVTAAAAVTSAQSMVNGNSMHPSLVQHSQLPQLPQATLNHSQNFPVSLTNVNPSEIEARMAEYFRLYHRDRIVATAGSSPCQQALAHHSSLSPQPSQSSLQPVPSPEPQREALDLGVRSSSVCSSPSVACGPSPLSSTSGQRKRDTDSVTSGRKRRLSDEDKSPETAQPSTSSNPRNIRICTEANNDEGSLNVSLTIEDATYRGVLFFDSRSGSKSDSSSSRSPPTNNDK
ncbi:PREDICTED: protein dead ringer-like isoform X2 [Polistes dominula]|uniref:Protein dead ringer-like isoform X2 n=1 Tax=Polistes dominula TaxID=743375 RepID=A0ABM1IAF8_POLDO|nr:PREDICTED: protein dead ringer-like isoform X2 [Polistes dominula]